MARPKTARAAPPRDAEGDPQIERIGDRLDPHNGHLGASTKRQSGLPSRIAKGTPSLERKTFSVSRLAEFVSQDELIKQTGHDVEDWWLVAIKELVDNGLDAAEDAGLKPVIEVIVAEDSITVDDNGPGMAPETVASITDYRVRTSSRSMYVSPSRGQQGNALQLLLAMPFSLDGERGETVVESRGVKHAIVFSVDPIRREPRVDRVMEPSPVNS